MSAGQFVISLDFELHWGVRDHTGVDDYRDNLLGVRQVVPALLARFRQREIHATWGTVGILFARTREEALEHAPRRRPGYKKRELDPYVDLENAGVDEQQDPFHFAGSLVEQVAATPHQELATHTYSHYYCLETGPMMADFEDDLRAAKSIGCRYGDVTKSIVFPRNQFDEAHLEAARRAGTVAFRGNPLTWFWRPHAYDQETVRERAFRFADAYFRTGPVRQVRPRRHPSGLVDVPATRFLRPWSPSFAPLETLKLRRIRAELTSAARHGGLCHLWWHPHNFGRYPTQNLAMLDQILDIVDELRAREGLQSLTMAEAAATA